MTALVESAIYRMGLDNAEYLRAAKETTAANLQLASGFDKLAAEEATLTLVTQKVGNEFERLESRYDRVIAIETRRRNALAQVNRIAEEEAVDLARKAALIDTVNSKYDQQVAALGRLRAPLQQGQGQARGFGIAIQQAGYQVGDFAVQVASGQGMLRPFIQQGTQLISMFGPWGAVIGAAGAVVGALAVGFGALEDATDDATAAQEAHNEAMRAAEELARALHGTNESSITALEKTRDRTIELTRADLAAAQAKIALIEATTMQGALEQAPDDIGRALDDVQRVVEAKTATIRDLINGMYGEDGKYIDGIRGRLATLQFGTEDSRAPMDPFANMGQDFSDSYYNAADGAKRLAEEAAKAAKETKALLDAVARADQAGVAEYERFMDSLGRSVDQADQRALAEWNAAQAEGLRVIEAVQTPLEEYTRNLGKLNQMYADGHVDAVTYARASERLEKAYRDGLSGAQRELEGFLVQSWQNIGGGITSALTAGEGGFRNFGDTAINVLADIEAMLIQVALLNPFENWITGGDKPVASDLFGFLGKGLGFVGSLFGGGLMADPNGAMLGRAGGGRVRAGETVWVGEAGPEPFTPDQDGMITPNWAATRGSSRSASVVVNNNIRIEGGSGDSGQNQDMIARMTSQIERAVRRVVQEEIGDQQRTNGMLNQNAFSFGGG